MRRGTTPVHKFYMDCDLNDLDVLYITYEQNGDVVLEKALGDEDVELDVDNRVIKVRLSQSDTLLFDSGDEYTSSYLASPLGSSSKVKIQIRWRTNSDRAYASDIVVTSVKEILKDGEI